MNKYFNSAFTTTLGGVDINTSGTNAIHTASVATI